jgi:mRNA interferase RelE/StbE
MHRLDMTKVAYEFLKDLQAKQYRQVGHKLLSLMMDPQPADAAQLRGYDQYWRVDVGEYRIIYRFDETTIFIILIGKRNDDEVYRDLRRRE